METKDLRKDRIILRELTRTDFRLRYQGSVLGYLWAVIRPMLMFGILYLVFAKFLRFGDGVPHYPVYLLTGTVLWNFFTECTSQGIQSLRIRGDLMRKISFPKWIIVASATATALINLLINLGVIIIFALLSGVRPAWTWLLVPLLIAELYFLSLGLAFFLGTHNVRYHDVASIWEVLVQALFYAVPVIYPLSLVTNVSPLYAKIIMLDPIAQVVQDVRFCLITPETITSWQILPGLFAFVPLLIAAAVLCLGLAVFSRRSAYFAEEI